MPTRQFRPAAIGAAATPAGAIITCAALCLCATARPSAAQDSTGVPPQPPAIVRPWWVGVAFGVGAVGMTSDQGRDTDARTFALAFRAGRALGPRLRLGFELGGWLLEAGDVWDPSTGESVSAVSVVMQVLPVLSIPLYLEAGVGFATYQTNGPAEFGSGGTGWTVGAGYAFQFRSGFELVPSVNVSGGQLRDIRNAIVTETGLRYGVTDARVSLIRRWGR